MYSNQKDVAREELVLWLSHPSELGKRPAKIECAGEFVLHDLRYYYFKYKKSSFGKWYLGVAGGFEEGSMEHCGHIFSEMQEYHESNAQEEAIRMVERIREYWMKQAERYE